MKLKNIYYLMRHGEAVSNVEKVISCWPERFHNSLTKKGIRQVEKSAKSLQNKKIDLIFASDLLRTKQTAEIVGKVLKIKPKFDKRLREYNVGVYNGHSIKEYSTLFPPTEERFKKRSKNGENYKDIQNRVVSFFKEVEKKNKDKNILIISHQAPLVLLMAWCKDCLVKQFVRESFWQKSRMDTAEIRKLN